MSRRVAIRKMPALAPFALAAGKLVGRGLLVGAGLGAGKKLMGGSKEKDTQQEANPSFTDKVQERGKQAASAGAAYAQAQQASQQQMEQRGQQMADKAKAGSQINTGEAMDMSWQMLKAWSFLPGFDEFDKHSIIQHAKKRKLKHVSNHDLGHHDMRFNQRYKPDQKMPKGAEKLTPRDLSLAYMDLMLRRNPKLIERGNQKTKVGGKDEFGNPNPDNFPGISFPLLQTDEAIRSTLDSDKGRMIEQYHPVFATGHAHHEPSEHPKFALVTANDAATQAGNRNTIGVTHTINRYSHEHYPIGDQAAKDAFYQPESVSPQARNKRIVAEEGERRHFGEFMQPVDLARMKDEGLSPSINLSNAEQKVNQYIAGQHRNPLAPEYGGDLRRQFQQYLIEQAKAQTKQQAVATTSRIQPGPYPGFVYYTNPNTGLTQMLNENDVPDDDDDVATGEPMDMAWRMLKGELQLPHQITEALRGDLTTLDRAHKMTDTNEGTLIEGIHPDMESAVKLLAEKHLGDLTPTMQRPVMPLFHSPFH